VTWFACVDNMHAGAEPPPSVVPPRQEQQLPNPEHCVAGMPPQPLLQELASHVVPDRPGPVESEHELQVAVRWFTGKDGSQHAVHVSKHSFPQLPQTETLCPFGHGSSKKQNKVPAPHQFV
jgi:hypothetical protein